MSYIHIHNGTLIDGTGAAPIPHANILIHDGHIIAAGDNLNDATITADQRSLTHIDAQGGYILPGLIDTHMHLMFEIMPLEKRVATPFSLNFYKAVQHMRRTIDAGITTVRDAGGNPFD
jgi:imidazolonepropionase-like amidohydrolase